MEISLIENIQREDLNPIEEAQAYKRLLEEFHLKQDEVAERVSKSRAAAFGIKESSPFPNPLAAILSSLFSLILISVQLNDFFCQIHIIGADSM